MQKQILKKILTFSIIAFFNVQNVFASDPTTEPLVQLNDLKYLGGFQIPRGDFGSPQYSGFSYGGTAIAYNLQNNSLFMIGHDDHQLAAEISIPSLINSSNLSDLNTAAVLQNFSDITEGSLCNLGSGGAVVSVSGCKIGGLMFWNNKLIGTVFGYYDANNNVKLSHFISNLNLATTGDFNGMYQVGTSPLVPGAGFIDGYMTQIPPEWQSLLGGSALTGNAALSIIGRTSLGPSAFVFDPDQLGVQNPVLATPLVYYTIDHPTLGTWGGSAFTFNMTTQIKGVVFPKGSRSILFFGRTGMGTPCYGPGTGIQSQSKTSNELVVWFSANPSATYYSCGDNQMSPSEASVDGCCYDPVSGSKGGHDYPYAYYVWAYDANDFLKVKNGTTNQSTGQSYQPWEILPYGTWQIDFPITVDARSILGVAYDPNTQRIYLSQGAVDTANFASLPVVQVFKIQGLNPTTYSISDFTTLISNWFHVGSGNVSDLNFDNIVNTKDLGIMMSRWE